MLVDPDLPAGHEASPLHDEVDCPSTYRVPGLLAQRPRACDYLARRQGNSQLWACANAAEYVEAESIPPPLHRQGCLQGALDAVHEQGETGRNITI